MSLDQVTATEQYKSNNNDKYNLYTFLLQM